MARWPASVTARVLLYCTLCSVQWQCTVHAHHGTLPNRHYIIDIFILNLVFYLVFHFNFCLWDQDRLAVTTFTSWFIWCQFMYNVWPSIYLSLVWQILRFDYNVTACYWLYHISLNVTKQNINNLKHICISRITLTEALQYEGIQIYLYTGLALSSVRLPRNIGTGGIFGKGKMQECVCPVLWKDLGQWPKKMLWGSRGNIAGSWYILQEWSLWLLWRLWPTLVRKCYD